MLDNLLGGLFDKEKTIYITIQESLKSVSEELECSMSELFIMIKPTDEKGNFKCWIYKQNKPIREITLKEIIGDD